MICSHCGAVINDTAAFCTSCGTPVSAQGGQQFQQPQQPQQQAYNNGFRSYFQAQKGRMVTPEEKKRVSTLALITLAAYIAMAAIGMLSSLITMFRANGFVINFFDFSLFSYMINAGIGVMFWLFCREIDTRPMLSGIPKIVLVALSFLSIFAALFSGRIGGVNIIIDLMFLSVHAAFAVVYMLAVTHKLGSDSTGRILTFVIAGVGGLCSIISLISSIVSNASVMMFGSAFALYAVMNILTNLVSFAAAMLMLCTMCFCVHYTSGND